VKRGNSNTSQDSVALKVINKVAKANMTPKNFPKGFIEAGKENERIALGTSLNPDL